jgi:hypothetical protein
MARIEHAFLLNPSPLLSDSRGRRKASDSRGLNHEGGRVRVESPATRGLSRNVVDDEFQQLMVPFLVRGYVS